MNLTVQSPPRERRSAAAIVGGVFFAVLAAITLLMGLVSFMTGFGDMLESLFDLLEPPDYYDYYESDYDSSGVYPYRVVSWTVGMVSLLLRFAAYLMLSLLLLIQKKPRLLIPAVALWLLAELVSLLPLGLFTLYGFYGVSLITTLERFFRLGMVAWLFLLSILCTAPRSTRAGRTFGRLWFFALFPAGFSALFSLTALGIFGFFNFLSYILLIPGIVLLGVYFKNLPHRKSALAAGNGGMMRPQPMGAYSPRMSVPFPEQEASRFRSAPPTAPAAQKKSGAAIVGGILLLLPIMGAFLQMLAFLLEESRDVVEALMEFLAGDSWLFWPLLGTLANCIWVGLGGVALLLLAIGLFRRKKTGLVIAALSLWLFCEVSYTATMFLMDLAHWDYTDGLWIQLLCRIWLLLFVWIAAILCGSKNKKRAGRVMTNLLYIPLVPAFLMDIVWSAQYLGDLGSGDELYIPYGLGILLIAPAIFCTGLYLKKLTKISPAAVPPVITEPSVTTPTETPAPAVRNPGKYEVPVPDGRRYWLFDFDGTLVDSMPAFISTMLRILDEYHIPYGEDIVKTITPLGYAGTAKYYRTLGVPLSEDAIIRKMYQYASYAYANEIRAKEGVIDTLRQMKARGDVLNVLTASPHAMLDPCLRRLGIYHLFTNVWSCDDFATTKANPEIYQMAARRICVPVESVIFVDDNCNADRTAKTVGMRVIGIYDDSSKDYVEEMQSVCDGYVYRFPELLDR